ncbi:MAG: type II restriction endonuclease [Chitinophagaceae bacterium]
MESVLSSAIETARKAQSVYTKFISSNDVGKTSHGESRSHQAGFYISKSFLKDVFEVEIQKGTDYERFVTIQWQDDFETDSRFKYYGSKNECHLTRLGKEFPFRYDDNIGDLLILCKLNRDYYKAFVLSTDSDMDELFAALNISPADANGLVPRQNELATEEKLLRCFSSYIGSLSIDFPPTDLLAAQARACYNGAYGVGLKDVLANPDRILLEWIDAEYSLFKAIENDRYLDIIQKPFDSVEHLVDIANMILNRRKSRAGKSLEHHLAELFNSFGLMYSSQSITEGNKKPDFLFPGGNTYHDKSFPAEKLTFLASKTTCKDRWRQVLNEADRIKTKHLFTLQQGISANQLKEMREYNIQLVIPRENLTTFPAEFRQEILSLNQFIIHAKERQ